jgi:hypothetical protein
MRRSDSSPIRVRAWGALSRRTARFGVIAEHARRWSTRSEHCWKASRRHPGPVAPPCRARQIAGVSRLAWIVPSAPAPVGNPHFPSHPIVLSSGSGRKHLASAATNAWLTRADQYQTGRIVAKYGIDSQLGGDSLDQVVFYADSRPQSLFRLCHFPYARH